MKKYLLILALALSNAVWAGDFEDGKVAYAAQKYAVALSKFTKAAEQGNADAQAALGSMHQKDVDVKQNNVEADWYQHSKFLLGNLDEMSTSTFSLFGILFVLLLRLVVAVATRKTKVSQVQATSARGESP